MGRAKQIDREKILDAAERLLASHGRATLTFEAVAKEAGISKGGIQSTFESKNALINALLARWETHYESAPSLIDDGNGRSIARAHVIATMDNECPGNEHVATLLACLMQTPEERQWVRSWYAKLLSRISAQDGGDPLARIAFFAAEGLFFMRYFGLHEFPDQEWEKYLGELKSLLEEKTDGEKEHGK